MKNNIKKYALLWWKGLLIQNLEDMSDCWAGYTMKYYPNKTDCYSLTDDQIINIWQQEHKLINRLIKIRKIQKNICSI